MSFFAFGQQTTKAAFGQLKHNCIRFEEKKTCKELKRLRAQQVDANKRKDAYYQLKFFWRPQNFETILFKRSTRLLKGRKISKILPLSLRPFLEEEKIAIQIELLGGHFDRFASSQSSDSNVSAGAECKDQMPWTVY